jgi:hypothetical protein
MRAHAREKSNVAAAVAHVLLAYGVKATLEVDERGSYYEFDLPEYWNRMRREKFIKALRQAQTG